MIFQAVVLPGNTAVTGTVPALNNLGSLVTLLLPYIFVIAGLILFFVIIGAGFNMMTSPGNPEKTKKASQQLTFGIVGFLIIFISYWIAQLLGSIFGISLLGG